ncbi:MAG: helix-turn-helix transcriptional regulator [Stappiaceae bacterium]
MNTNELDRVVVAWRAASEHLSGIRDLSDVASIIGLSESTFRSLHRQTLGGSAGKHLQEVRLLTAEKLLSTTGSSISEIARQVGYAHPESFSAAFKASRGQSPGRHRRWSKQFA